MWKGPGTDISVFNLQFVRETRHDLTLLFFMLSNVRYRKETFALQSKGGLCISVIDTITCFVHALGISHMKK